MLLSMFATPQDVASGLRGAGYATDPVLVKIIWLATKMQKPILIEGPMMQSEFDELLNTLSPRGLYVWAMIESEDDRVQRARTEG